MTPAFHFSPRRGWMNDPNGLVELDGVHHLFFQHNPDGLTPERICWGHATSPDLVRWTEHPVALRPGDHGDHDVDGCWSGCTVVLPDRVAVVYSGNRGGRQLPAVAFADDASLVSWTKAAANPVVPAWPDVPDLTDLRDHTVLAEDGRWRQVLAGGRDARLTGRRRGPAPADGGRGGFLPSYLSAGHDLTRWTYDGVLLDGAEADLPGEVWECPDLYRTGPGDAAALILSWYTSGTGPAHGASDVLWLTGDLTGGRFRPTRYGRLDLGDRFYAPQSYPTSDGRRLMLGWLRTQLDPGSAGRPSVGTASLPRELRIVDGRLQQRPAAEVAALPRAPLGRIDADQQALELPGPTAALELVLRAPTPAALAGAVLRLTGPDTVLELDHAVLATPSSWWRTAAGWEPEAPTSTSATTLVDAGLVETFTDDGRALATSRLALGAVTGLSLSAPAGVTAEVRAVGGAAGQEVRRR